MKIKKSAFYLLLFIWVGLNTFFVLAENAQSIKNLNASSATAYFNVENNAVTTSDKPWTLSFNRTSIENNAGVTLQAVNQSFDQVTAAPETGYVTALEKGSGTAGMNMICCRIRLRHYLKKQLL